MGKGGHGHSHAGRTASDNHGHSHNKQDDNDHGHSHGPSKFLGICVCSDTLRISSMLSMILTFFFVELIVGQISHSISLTADAFHMLSDALALIIGLVTAVMSKRSSTKNTYGWVRAEVLGPLVNAVFLCSMCLGIVFKAIERLFEPHKLEDIDLLLYTGTLGLLINLLGLLVFGHGHSHNVPHDLDQNVEFEEDLDDEEVCEIGNGDRSVELEIRAVENDALVRSRTRVERQAKSAAVEAKGKSKKRCCAVLSSSANMNIRAVFLHVLADALGSVIVIISALINKFQTELNVPKQVIDYIDPVLSLSLVALILSATLPLLKESALILLQTVPKDIEVSALKRDLLLHVPSILNIHELHIWKLSGHKIIATAHVICHNSSEYMENASKIKKFFHQRGIHSTTIQPEFTEYATNSSNEVPVIEEMCLIECVTSCVKETCCGDQTGIVRNKSVASQLRAVVVTNSSSEAVGN